MKLQVFNGGKSTRLAPHLIGVNEAIVYDNINNETAVLESVKDKGDTLLAIEKYAYYYIAKDMWVSSATFRNYVEYQEKLYYTEDNAIPQVYDGTLTANLGIRKPGSIPTVATGAAGVLNATYQYVYTYYNSYTGVESGPSFVSVEVSPSSDKVDISGILVSSDPQVTHKRIYRVGGGLTSFTLVDTISAGATTYTDNIADTAVDGRLLETTTY